MYVRNKTKIVTQSLVVSGITSDGYFSAGTSSQKWVSRGLSQFRRKDELREEAICIFGLLISASLSPGAQIQLTVTGGNKQREDRQHDRHHTCSMLRSLTTQLQSTMEHRAGTDQKTLFGPKTTAPKPFLTSLKSLIKRGFSRCPADIPNRVTELEL